MNERTKQLSLQTSLSNTGYGIAGKYLAKELHKHVRLSIFPYGPGNFDSQDEASLFKTLVNNGDFFDYNAPCINLWHQFLLSHRIGRGPYYGFPIFELDTFRDIEKHHLCFPDFLITTSQWGKQVLQDNLKNSPIIYVVPLGVDRSIFHPLEPKRDMRIRDNPDQYIFFNIGKWEKRKSHDIIPSLFCKAFDKSDNVKLIMVPYNPFLKSEEVNKWIKLYKNCQLSNKITILDKVDTHQDISNIINICNCGLFPSRAEGWNLELLESMACGKPVITTDYSAHTEYVTPENAFLIKPEAVVPAYDQKWFFGQGNWMDIDYDEEEQLIEYMRECFKSHNTFNSEGLETAKKFAWENSAKKLLEVII